MYLFQTAYGLEWRRPHELVEEPHLFVGGGDRFDINQVRQLKFLFISSKAAKKDSLKLKFD